MIFVTKEEWARLEESLGADALRAQSRHEHGGRVCLAGERMIRLGRLTREQEDYQALGFEHIHFEVVDSVRKARVRLHAAH